MISELRNRLKKKRKKKTRVCKNCLLLNNENRKLKHELVRVTTEFEDFKKRLSNEAQKDKNLSNETIFREILEICDPLEMSLDLGEDSTKNLTIIVESVGVIIDKTHNILNRFNISAFDSVGEVFDPHKHEAVGITKDDEQPENTVVKQLRKGYTIENRLLRPATVMVSKKSGGEEDG